MSDEEQAVETDETEQTEQTDDDSVMIPEAEDEETETEETEEREEQEDQIAALKADYEGKIGDMQKEINRLGYALRTASKEKPEGKKDDEPQFTKAQLLGIMQEHKDDPAVLFQVFEELTKNATKDAEVSATKAADIKTKKNGMDQFLNGIEGLDDESSKESQNVSKIMGDMYLDDHPFGKFLAVAAHNLLNLEKTIEAVKEKTKKEILGEAAENNRKKTISTNKSTTSHSDSGKKPVTLSNTAAETAKNLFGDDKKLAARYAKMLANSKKVGTFQTA